MGLITKSNRIKRAKKLYQRPQLTNLGSVQQITLKIGSISDGLQPHQA